MCQAQFSKEDIMNIEKVENRIKILTNQHSGLENELKRLLNSPVAGVQIESLKKKKLHIKDELVSLHKTRYELMNEINWE